MLLGRWGAGHLQRELDWTVEMVGRGRLTCPPVHLSWVMPCRKGVDIMGFVQRGLVGFGSLFLGVCFWGLRGGSCSLSNSSKFSFFFYLGPAQLEGYDSVPGVRWEKRYLFGIT